MKRTKKTIIGIIMLIGILLIEPFGVNTQASASVKSTTKKEVTKYINTYLKDYLCYVTEMRYRDPSVKLHYDKYVKTNLAIHYIYSSGKWGYDFWKNDNSKYAKVSYGGYVGFNKNIKRKISSVQKKLFGVKGKIALHKLGGWNYNKNLNALRKKAYFTYNDFYLSKDKKCLLYWRIDTGCIETKASVKKITKKKNVYTISYNVGVGPISKIEEIHSYKIKLKRKGKSFVICNIQDGKK